eukprot:CAMPEP_0119483584 /NCGR_PEP_ID=MMETSP1344-20130328/10924_1 /TAXON_ID=236787 /ORGANISM="Florenciella parvula, Strain CCMP2471" /LENGTH=613 /DNA_ID=CAMNT_0007518089 /DNA_START=94 /DNA_END=1937 /DNA_ORIENTATION=-
MDGTVWWLSLQNVFEPNRASGASNKTAQERTNVNCRTVAKYRPYSKDKPMSPKAFGGLTHSHSWGQFVDFANSDDEGDGYIVPPVPRPVNSAAPLPRRKGRVPRVEVETGRQAHPTASITVQLTAAQKRGAVDHTTRGAAFQSLSPKLSGKTLGTAVGEKGSGDVRHKSHARGGGLGNVLGYLVNVLLTEALACNNGCHGGVADDMDISGDVHFPRCMPWVRALSPVGSWGQWFAGAALAVAPSAASSSPSLLRSFLANLSGSLADADEGRRGRGARLRRIRRDAKHRRILGHAGGSRVESWTAACAAAPEDDTGGQAASAGHSNQQDDPWTALARDRNLLTKDGQTQVANTFAATIGRGTDGHYPVQHPPNAAPVAQRTHYHTHTHNHDHRWTTPGPVLRPTSSTDRSRKQPDVSPIYSMYGSQTSNTGSVPSSVSSVASSAASGSASRASQPTADTADDPWAALARDRELVHGNNHDRRTTVVRAYRHGNSATRPGAPPQLRQATSAHTSTGTTAGGSAVAYHPAYPTAGSASAPYGAKDASYGSHSGSRGVRSVSDSASSTAGSRSSSHEGTGTSFISTTVSMKTPGSSRASSRDSRDGADNIDNFLAYL